MKQVVQSDDSDFGSLITMKIGTLTHDWLEDIVSGDVFHDILGPDWSVVGTELDLTDWLPSGWTGTCDYLFQHVPTGRYVVGDLKTAKPESLAYLMGSPKKEHCSQVSCYHTGLAKKFGRENMAPDLFVCYLPKGKTAKQENVLPVVLTAPAVDVTTRLRDISKAVNRYVEEFERTGEYQNKYLDPMPAPEPKLGWNRATNQWDVTLRPSWTEEYIGAAFGPELCPRTPSQKVGHWTTDGYYIPRKGIVYGGEIPSPTQEDFKRRQYA